MYAVPPSQTSQMQIPQMQIPQMQTLQLDLPGCRPPRGREQTDRCKNITLPQTSFAGGKNKVHPCTTKSRKQNMLQKFEGLIGLLGEKVINSVHKYVIIDPDGVIGFSELEIVAMQR